MTHYRVGVTWRRCRQGGDCHAAVDSV